MKHLKAITLISALAFTSMLSAQVAAMPFNPVMDEFWIVKNGSELFRDSFSDGLLPPNGPDGAATYSNSPQAGTGGFTGESNGKLTMTPALGAQTLITGTVADTFTGGLRLASTNPASSNGLAITDDIEIHGLFDLTSLPGVSGQQFGIRLTDRSTGNTGDDVIQLSVIKSSVSGNIGVRLAELDFVADTSQTADFDSISSLLPSASQIELVITKAAGTNIIGASYTLLNAFNVSVGGGVLDNINNVTLGALSVYNGENFTRAQFFSTDTGVPIPAPAPFATLLIGLAGLGYARRKRAA